jgi:hypothetical protein
VWKKNIKDSHEIIFLEMEARKTVEQNWINVSLCLFKQNVFFLLRELTGAQSARIVGLTGHTVESFRVEGGRTSGVAL